MAAPGLSVVGGDVFTDDGTIASGEVHLADGLIRSTPAADSHHIDVTDVPGALVVPGLVDLHVHAFRGQDSGIDIDTVGARTGVTTMLDAGSAGGHIFDAFVRTSVRPVQTRVRALVNVATIGITSFVLKGELHETAYLDRDALMRTIERHSDVIHGIKVRASANVGGQNVGQALDFARRMATETSLPLMVHLGPAPCAVDDILAVLSDGDMLTHCFSGWAGNTLVNADGQIRASAREARARGVIFDVGYGASGFDPTVAAQILSLGFLPDTLSSDLHLHNTRIGGLPDVLNAFLTLGVPLPTVLALATHRPGHVLGLPGVGRLQPDISPADVVVLARTQTGARTVSIPTGHTPTSLGPVLTIRDGRVVHDSRKGTRQ